MAAEDRAAAAACIVIALLMEEDDERRTRGPDRDWIKRKREKGAFQNIVKELAAEDLPSFKNFMCMDYVTWISCKGCVDESGRTFSAILPDQQEILRMLAHE